MVNPANGSRLTYGEIAAFGKVPGDAAAVDKSELKPKSQFRLIGKSVPRRDVPLKVNGSAQYAIDVRLPGMVYATALHSPAHGNAPESWNDAEVKAMPGVIATVKLADGIAVVAETFEQAMAARRALKVTWSKGKTTASIPSGRSRTTSRSQDDPDGQGQDRDQAKGDVSAAFAGAAKRYKAEFLSDYAYHAQMEPLNAVARFNEAGDRLEVWDGSQDLGQRRAACWRKSLGSQARAGRGPSMLSGRRLRSPFATPTMRWKRRSSPAPSSGRSSSSGRARRTLPTACSVRSRFQRWRLRSTPAARSSAGGTASVGDDGGSALVTGGMKISPYYAVPNQQPRTAQRRRMASASSTGAPSPIISIFFAIEGLVDEMAARGGCRPGRIPALERMSLTPKARAVVEKAARDVRLEGPAPARPSARALR